MSTPKKKTAKRKTRKLTGDASSSKPKRGGKVRTSPKKRSRTKGASDTTVARAYEKAVAAGDFPNARKFLQHIARRSGWSVYDPRWGISSATQAAYIALSAKSKGSHKKKA
jgi:hypothetical protein